MYLIGYKTTAMVKVHHSSYTKVVIIIDKFNACSDWDKVTVNDEEKGCYNPPGKTKKRV